MSFWRKLRHKDNPSLAPAPGHLVHLTLQGWEEDDNRDNLRTWHDAQGDVLSLAIAESTDQLPTFSDDITLQRWARGLAEREGAGLIEVRLATGILGATNSLIYKRLEKPAYIYTGMLFVPQHLHLWTISAKERGITGIREAIVTSDLMNAGKLTIQEYQRSWACDPYDPDYHGVDGNVLYFISDNEFYDERFPEHPLSKVRELLSTLPNVVQIGSMS